MPTIIPGYVYSIFATIIVGAIIIYGCTISTINIKNQAQNQELTNIDQYVATQSLRILTCTTQDNQNITQYLNLPTQIGNQPYWITITNDSTNAWIESGFGTTATTGEPQVYIPSNIEASGTFLSNYGWPTLQCWSANQTINLELTNGEQA